LPGLMWNILDLCFWILVCSTATNLLDHADGVAASAVLTSAALSGSEVGLISAAACLGFLVRNYPPAKIFLGDSGSHLIGYLLVISWISQGTLAVAAGTSIPLMDLIVVVCLRTARKRPIWVGGTDHSSHMLARAGIHPSLIPVIAASSAMIGPTLLYAYG